MRVYYRCFSIPACVGKRDSELEAGSSSACPRLALVAGVGGRYVLAGVKIWGFPLYIFLFLRVLGWRVGVCVYTQWCVHTHRLFWYSMWDQVWPGDGHLASRKNPDRLKRGICVDHTFVQNAFVDVDAGLRVLMIWPGRLTSIFLFNASFLLRKVKDVTRTTISKPQSLTVTAVRIIDCTFKSSKQKYYIISLFAIIKAIFIHLLVVVTSFPFLKIKAMFQKQSS